MHVFTSHGVSNHLPYPTDTMTEPLLDMDDCKDSLALSITHRGAIS